MERSRSFSSFDVSLATDSRRKQKLSRNLSLRLPGERSDIEVRLTIREAKALQKFLNDTLSDSE